MAATTRTRTTPTPPRGSFSVSQRLLRGYGPLAVLIVLLMLMALLVPSKSPTRLNAAGVGAGEQDAGATDGTTADGATDTTVAPDAAAGGAAAGGAAGAPRADARGHSGGRDGAPPS